MPRVRYRRLFLLCIVLCVSFLLAINSLFWFQIKPSVVAPEDEDYPEESNQTEQLAVERKPVVIYNFTLDDRPKQHYRMEWSTGRTSTSKPWFMRNGDIRPEMSYAPKLSLWPEEIENNDDPRSDRIINQLMYVPEGYVEENFLPKGSLPLKKILLAYGKTGWSGLPFGRKKFLDDKCPVNACFIMSNPELIAKADAVIFKDRFVWPKQGRQNLNQIWIAFLLESPYNTQLFRPVDSNIFNWTATYRHDSDIVAPYEKYTTYESLYDHQLPLNLDLFENRTLTSLPIVSIEFTRVILSNLINPPLSGSLEITPRTRQTKWPGLCQTVPPETDDWSMPESFRNTFQWTSTEGFPHFFFFVH